MVGMKASAFPRMQLDLTSMPQGKTYEDRYQGYLAIFKQIAETPPQVTVEVFNPPWSWFPLLKHLNCIVDTPRKFFDHCDLVRGAMAAMGPSLFDRTTVEVLAGFRPECADALWKIDMQWAVPFGRTRVYEDKGEFIVTTNGAFHRPEVLSYMRALDAYQPTKKRVVLVPCAADKPYPAPMHMHILSRMPDDWYMMNATGVVGLIPQDLWNIAPHYDSGIPNRWRLFETIKRYFNQHEHEQIIVYCDFYSEAIQAAFRAIGQDNRVTYILPVKFYADYVDLTNPTLLDALTRKFQTFERRRVPRFPNSQEPDGSYHGNPAKMG